MRSIRCTLLAAMTAVVLVLMALVPFQANLHAAEFRAGAFAQPISPTMFPAPVNGSMKGAFAMGVTDPMHARCLALSDGRKELIFCVVDACLIPREICEQAKQIAAAKTGVPAGQMLISATHTHSAAALTPAFQSDPDPEYVASVPQRIAQGIIQAHANLEPAEIAWGKGSDPTQVFNRRWLVKEGESYANPFGVTTDRAWMNPGYKNAKVSKPAGPVDPEVAVLAVRSAKDQRPLALLANYSLHYVGGNPPISADYFAAFAEEITQRLKARDARYEGKPAFVGIMSNGTSGDVNNVNFAGEAPARRLPGEQIRKVAASVAEAAMKAYEQLVFQPHAALDCLEEDIRLKVRKATAEELSRARETLATTPKDKDGQFSDRPEIYAREAVLLDAYPDEMPVKLQVHRIGELGVAAIPCEVFVEIGLELKARSPLQQHFTISLANGYNGYLPTVEQHGLGGYETWRARSSYLEVQAADKIKQRLLAMLVQLKERQ
jgi:neutral ceramidase